jgi:hypothetical protein
VFASVMFDEKRKIKNPPPEVVWRWVMSALIKNFS